MRGRAADRPPPPLPRPCPQPITKKEFLQLSFPASMHALGHIAANLSFAAVAISLTHTVKTLEPAFNVVLSKLLLGNGTPLPVVATLLPIMVSAPRCAELGVTNGATRRGMGKAARVGGGMYAWDQGTCEGR
jgi:Triose-phosphate Transporter family